MAAMGRRIDRLCCAVLETCIPLGRDFMCDNPCSSPPVVFSQFTEGSSQGEEGFTALEIDGPPRKRYLRVAVMHTLIRSQDLFVHLVSFLSYRLRTISLSTDHE